MVNLIKNNHFFHNKNNSLQFLFWNFDSEFF